MNDSKKYIIGAVAVVAVALAGFVVFKTTSGGGDTNLGAQDEAKQLVHQRSATDVVPPDQYKKMIAGAMMPGAHKGK